MVGSLKQARALVVAIAITLGTAVAAVVGIVPRAGQTTDARIAGVADVAELDREAERAPDAPPPAAAAVTVETAAPVTSTVPTIAPPTTTIPPVTTEPETAAAGLGPAVSDAAPAPFSPPALPARRVPTPAEVQQAIRGMERFVTFKSGLLGLLADVPTPTAAQVDELGDKACTAFDQGQTVEQVKATGLTMASDNPWVTISEAGADYVVRTAVALYCPGHVDKLG